MVSLRLVGAVCSMILAVARAISSFLVQPRVQPPAVTARTRLLLWFVPPTSRRVTETRDITCGLRTSYHLQGLLWVLGLWQGVPAECIGSSSDSTSGPGGCGSDTCGRDCSCDRGNGM